MQYQSSFYVSSFLCDNAGNIWELVFFRLIQGFGGGALLVTAQTLITESYPPEKRGIGQATLGWTATQSGMLMVPAAIVTAMMMPIVGQLLQRGVKQQYLVALGMIFFFLYSYWGYLILTPDTGKDAFFNMLLLRGEGLGLLFVPISTLALSTLKGREIGEGAAFTGMMRQLGGSFGVAVITTFIARQNMLHRNDLVSKLDVNSPIVQQRVDGLQHSFMSKGLSPDVALKSGYKILDFTVTKQAMVMSYMDVFLYLGVMFLICVPFVLWTKSGKGKVDTSAVH